MAFNTNGAATAGPKGLFSIDPLDVRLQVKTKAALADIKAGTVYESIHVFCQEDKKFYTPKNYSTTAADANVEWEEVKSDSAWGQISGTLSDQTDLQNALDSKLTTTDEASKVYGTDDQGAQITYDLSEFHKGGWHEVSTVSDRDAISDDLLEVGMIVYVTSEAKGYILTSLNTEVTPILKTWEEYKPGQGDYIRKITTYPLSSVSPLVDGEIIQYQGPTVPPYWNGYFYKDEQKYSYISSKSSNMGPASINIIDESLLRSYIYRNQSAISGGWSDIKLVFSGTYAATVYATNGETEVHLNGFNSQEEFEHIGLHVSSSAGYPVSGTIAYIAPAHVWTQTDVQPQTDLIWGNITGTLSDQTDLQGALDSKQDTLTAGTNITIEEDAQTGDLVISSTTSESYFRGKFSTWDLVPTDYRSYYPDYTGSTKPTRTDYMVIEDPSGYVKPGTPIQIYNEPMSGGTAFARFVFGATDVTLNHNEVSQRGAEGIIIGTNGNQLRITYASEVWYLTSLDVPVIVDGITKPINEIALQWHYERPSQETLYKEINFTGQGGYEGTWRFSYQSNDWDTSGKNGWEPEYQIEDVLPIATDTVAGITKLYTTTGSNTDGTMDQNSITTELGQRVLQVTEFPEASASNEGQLVQFIGSTGSSGTTGWFYTSTQYQIPYSLTVEGDSDVTVSTYNTETYLSQLSDTTVDSTTVFTYDGTDWKDSDSNVVDLTDWGITISGTPVSGSTITGTYVAPSTGYRWVQTDTQPTEEYHESFFRGPFYSWSNVPGIGQESQYYVDFYGSHRPGLTDYIVITNPEDYVSEETAVLELKTHSTGGGDASIDVTIIRTGEIINYYFPNVSQWTQISGTDFYISYGRPEASSGWGIRNLSNPFTIDGVVYPVGSVYHWTYNVTINKTVNGYHVYRGMWRFSYTSNSWDSDGKNGWRPEYQIENVLPIADEQTLGIAKLYQSTGTHTDGAISQKAATDHITDKNNPHEVTKAQVGLENIDNTSDLDKPISTATQTALDGKVDHYSSLPTASQNYENKIVQYIGNTDSSSDLYQGFFYVCKAQGTDPETYAWEILQNVQPTAKPIIWVTYEDYEG